jgi:hypothetical protein
MGDTMPRFFLFFLTAISLAAATLPASAQVPPGSYQRTCRSIDFDGSVLAATCADASGRAVRSRIDVNNCGSTIANANGRLVCDGGGRGPGRYDAYEDRPMRPRGRGLPPGSWRASCADPQMDGPVLTAVCATPGGRGRPSSIDARSCGSIGNRYGQLVCER